MLLYEHFVYAMNIGVFAATAHAALLDGILSVCIHIYILRIHVTCVSLARRDVMYIAYYIHEESRVSSFHRVIRMIHVSNAYI